MGPHCLVDGNLTSKLPDLLYRSGVERTPWPEGLFSGLWERSALVNFSRGGEVVESVDTRHLKCRGPERPVRVRVPPSPQIILHIFLPDSTSGQLWVKTAA